MSEPTAEELIITRQGKLLHAAAVALSGREPLLTMWGWADIPDKILALKAQLGAALAVVADARLAYEQSVSRGRMPAAPEDADVRRLGDRMGYGALMSAASRIWFEKDSHGAFTVGHCFGVLKADLDAYDARTLVGNS